MVLVRKGTSFFDNNVQNIAKTASEVSFFIKKKRILLQN